MFVEALSLLASALRYDLWACPVQCSCGMWLEMLVHMQDPGSSHAFAHKDHFRLTIEEAVLTGVGVAACTTDTCVGTDLEIGP